MTETQIASDNSPLVVVNNLFMHFPISKGIFMKRAVSHVRAVDGVSFQIRQGETLGVVGESGSGKTTLGRTIFGLYKPTSGQIEIGGIKVDPASRRQMKEIRRGSQMIFQDPFSSLKSSLDGKLDC